MTTQPVEQTQSSATAETSSEPIIVALAGAAGSPQALELFLRNLPDDTGISLVLMMRVSTKAINELPARLQARTNMPVVAAVDSLAFKADHVYIVPAGAQAIFSDGQLLLQPTKKSGEDGESPLDRFFSSFAAQYGEKATAVLFSGTGHDAIAGLQKVIDNGGLIFIQDPKEAAHGALLRRALALFPESSTDTQATQAAGPRSEETDTGSRLIVGSPGDLARQLVQQRGMLKYGPVGVVDAASTQFDEVYQEILEAIRVQTGHDLSHYKLSTLYRRVMRRMQMAGILQAEEYVNFLKSHEQETTALFKDSLVSVTSFYRDPDAYEMLEQDCIPQLFADKRRSDYVRVWVAGCATGEEAYSVAIQLMEYAAQMKEPPRFQVFATDLDEEAIAVARQGLYPATIAKDMTPARFERFFAPEDESYRISTEIREHVLFAVHDLLKDPPFSRLDLICCRNVMIYFNREAQEKVFAIFHYALSERGYLFLGSSESVDSTPDLFAVVDKHCHLYQRRDVVNTPARRLSPATLAIQNRFPTERKRGQPEAPAHTVEDLYTAWSLRVHTPARLLLNESYEITHMFGDVHKFLQERQGAVTQNILERIHEDIRLDLQTALYPAFNKGERTISRLLQVEIGEVSHLIQLQVGPVQEPAFPDNLIEVVFVIQDSAPIFSLSMAGETEHADLAMMTRMEEELMRTRERMQTVIEEYEDFSQELKTSNEELQSINEELKSTTEELETSKEELQSMNEELVTLNGELNNKIEELNRANSDLLNFISSTDVGAIFLDQELRISRFTPRAMELFNLIEGDVGRPMRHITHRINHTALPDLVAHVRETADHIEETVQSTDNRWYILRLIPYRTVEERIDGVVVTFIDISDLKRAESEERQRRQQQVLVELSRQALLGNKLHALLQAATEQVAHVLGMGLCKVLEVRPDQESLLLQAGTGWQAGLVGSAIIPIEGGSQAGYTLHADGPVVVRDLQTETRFHGPSLLTEHNVRSGISVTIDGTDGPYGVLGVHDQKPRNFATYDVDFLQAVANTLAAAVARQRQTEQLQFQANILGQINDAVIAVDNQSRITYLNAAAAHQYAVDNVQQLIGSPLNRLHEYRWYMPEAADEAKLALEHNGSWRGENIHVRHDGAEIPVESTVNVLTENGKDVGVLATIRDMTEQKAAEAALRSSEERYRYLFETMDEGFCVVEILSDSAGKPTDYRFLEANPAFEAFTGLKGAVGHTARELVPGLEDHWIEIYGKVAQTGDPIRFEQGSEAMGRWFNVYAFRIGAPEDTRVAILFNDITNRKQMEDALRYQAYLLENVQDAIISTDLEFRIRTWNQGAERIYGWTAEETVGRLVSDLLATRYVVDEAEDVRQTLRSEGKWQGEVWHSRKDGHSICISNTTTMLYDEDGTAVGSVASNRDVTAQRQAEAAVQRSERHLRNILNNLFAFVGILTPDGTLIEANRTALQSIDIPVEEIIGRQFADTYWWSYDAAVQDDLRTAVKRAAAGEAVRYDVPVRLGENQFITIDFMLGPVRNEHGEITHLVPSGVDITERTRAEQALRESEELRRLALEGAQLGTWAIDLENGTTYLDERVRAIFGVGPTEEVSTRTILSRVHPDDRSLVTDTFLTAVDMETDGLYNTEVRLVWPDGSTHWIATRGRIQPVETDEGWRPIRLVGIVQDITERKQAEDELRYQGYLLQNIQDAIVSTDLSFNIRSWNAGAERMYGWRAEEAIGQPVMRLLATKYLEPETSPDRLRDQLYQTGSWQGEVIHQHKDSEKLIISSVVIMLRDRDGSPTGAVAVNRDITVQKRAEQAMAASEAKFATAFSSSPLILAITSLKTGKLLEVNESFVRVSGYSREEALGRTTAELGLWLDEEERMAGLEKLRRGEAIRNVEAMFRVRDGSLRYCLTGATIVEINGERCVLNSLADITEQKEFERALQTSEEQLRLITDNVSGLISYIDNTEHYRFVSGTYEQWFCQSPSTIIGTHIIENIGEVAYERVSPYVRQTLAGERTSFESTLDYPDGKRRTVMATYVPDVDADGTILGFYALVTDITSRKLAEEQLRRSEEQFRAVQQTTPDGFMIFESIRNEDGAITDFRWAYTNPAAERLLGRSHEDLVGKQLLEEMPGNREDGIFDAYVQVVETGQVWQREFLYAHEGLRHWFRTTAAKTEDGFAVAFADITANKEAEAELRASEDRFRSAFEQAAVGMAHLDVEGNYVRVNERLCEILGYSREELLQKNFIEITHPDDLETDVAQTNRLLAGAILHHSMEKRYICKDGTSLWTNMTSSTVRSDTGEVKYSIAVIEDISARKAAEAALRELNATLEERIAERTAELEQSNVELERSNYDLDQFAYVASHDLKAPLRGIDSLAAWISEDAGAVLPEESKGHLSKLRARVQRMERLLEDLLVYSRIGRTDGQIETIDTATLLADIADLQAAPAGFTITLADNLPTLQTYRAPLELVFRNLIGNAIKHHHNPAAGEITIQAQKQDQGAFIQFTVADNGPGIDEQHHKRIFLMFQTLRPRDEIEASGMGLAIVQRTVEYRGGTIWVESALGAGTKVHFTWPNRSTP